ncbi:MAG TPA: Sec-independent protein translocase protein TatB [Rhizomicrobium sp.]|nr:Sec-independent protein translocase protein TatB [Rhizomicrobium sp.]
MLDFSWSHILIVLIVALVVVGPKDLPRLMRILGQWLGKMRRMAEQFRASFDEMARQSELEELRAEIDAMRKERLQNSILPPEVHREETQSEPPAPAEPPAS